MILQQPDLFIVTHHIFCTDMLLIKALVLFIFIFLIPGQKNDIGNDAFSITQFGSANWFARSIKSQVKSTLRRITRHIFGRFKSYLIATRILSIVPKNLLKLITFRRVLKLSTENKDIQSTELYTPNHRSITSFAVFKPRQPTIYDIT